MALDLQDSSRRLRSKGRADLQGTELRDPPRPEPVALVLEGRRRRRRDEDSPRRLLRLHEGHHDVDRVCGGDLGVDLAPYRRLTGRVGQQGSVEQRNQGTPGRVHRTIRAAFADGVQDLTGRRRSLRGRVRPGSGVREGSGVIIGAFQRTRAYEVAEPRWKQLAATACAVAGCVLLARMMRMDVVRHDTDAGRRARVNVSHGAPSCPRSCTPVRSQSRPHRN